MSATWTSCEVEPAAPKTRLWGKNSDCTEKTERPACSAAEGDEECRKEALVSLWRNDQAESAVSLCFRHALEQNAIFFVEPVCRQDFYNSEYEFLLGRSTIGQRLAESLTEALPSAS
jgi:hypothetical protein